MVIEKTVILILLTTASDYYKRRLISAVGKKTKKGINHLYLKK